MIHLRSIRVDRSQHTFFESCLSAVNPKKNALLKSIMWTFLILILYTVHFVLINNRKSYFVTINFAILAKAAFCHVMKHTIFTNIFLQWCTWVILGFADITSTTSRRKTCLWIFKNLHIFLISPQFAFILRNAKFLYVILFKTKIGKHLFIKV